MGRFPEADKERAAYKICLKCKHKVKKSVKVCPKCGYTRFRQVKKDIARKK